MIIIMKTFVKMTVFYTFIQGLLAVTTKEYNQRTNNFRSDPNIEQFLKRNEDILSRLKEYGKKFKTALFQISKNETGHETLKYLKNEIDIILKHENSNEVLRKIFSATDDILKSKSGLENVIAIAKYFEIVFSTPDFLETWLSTKKAMLSVTLAPINGLKAAVLLKQNEYDIMPTPGYAALQKILNTALPHLNL